MSNLFETGEATFSTCGKYRYSLFRGWDNTLPLVMFIGLNPSTANADTNDQTINTVIAISKYNGFGGVYMLNCFPYISTDPNALIDFGNTARNDHELLTTALKCNTVVFAWGAFKVVKKTGRNKELMGMFKTAKALKMLKDGSPRHPLYCKYETALIPFIYE